jgi:hypothetical protein
MLESVGSITYGTTTTHEGIVWSYPTPADLSQYNAVLGGEPPSGELVKFSNAILARAERNRNGDQIDTQGIQELAKTLPLMPLDVEHVPDRVFAFFVDAQAVGDTLVTSGIMFAKRFPDIVKEIMSGERHLSIEAHAREAQCSVCNIVFASEKEYCTHLAGRPNNGASRILRGLKAIGGGAVKRNAGTETFFDRNGFTLIASLHDSTSPTEDSEDETEDQAACGNPSEETDMEELEKVQAALAARETELAAAQAQVVGLQAQINDLTAAQTTLTAAHETEIAKLKLAGVRKLELLQADFTLDQINALEAKLADTDPDVFKLLLETQVAAKTVVVQGATETPKKPHGVIAAQTQDLKLDGDGWDAFKGFVN